MGLKRDLNDPKTQQPDGLRDFRQCNEWLTQVTFDHPFVRIFRFNSSCTGILIESVDPRKKLKRLHYLLIACIAGTSIGFLVLRQSDERPVDPSFIEKNKATPEQTVALEPSEKDSGSGSETIKRAEGPDSNDESLISQKSTQTQPHLVGKKVCKECHADNFRMHSQHGHAHTFHVLNDSPEIVSKFAGKTFNGGEQFGTYHYQANAETTKKTGTDNPIADADLTATIPTVFGDNPFPLQYALGSGHNAYTLLTLITEENGETAALEHRASWYTGQDGLNITPGHSKSVPADGLELFGNISRGDDMNKCIDCHTTSAEIYDEQIHNLIPSVNCEKCHGPGSEHVRLARSQSEPPAYSVGKDDWDTESEIQLCGDCHRLPKNISEKELREYPDLLVRFQPVGFLRSRCYLESNSELRCTTCHGPHESLHEVSQETHIQNCLNCHTTPEHTICPVSPKDDCIRCHMPAMEQEQGLTFHDHWIRVRDQ